MRLSSIILPSDLRNSINQQKGRREENQIYLKASELVKSNIIDSVCVNVLHVLCGPVKPHINQYLLLWESPLGVTPALQGGGGV